MSEDVTSSTGDSTLDPDVLPEDDLAPGRLIGEVDAEPAPEVEVEVEAPKTWRSVISSAGVRILILPISAGLGVFNTRLIIEHFGKATYAQYGLLVAIGALLPFADLGMSAAIMNAVGGSDSPSRDAHVRKVLITSIRALICSAAALLLLDVVITSMGWWRPIMGDALIPISGPKAAAACLALIALTLPIAFGQRVLTGLGKNHITIAMLGLQTPVTLGILLLIINRDWSFGSGSYLPVIPYFVIMLISVGATVLAARLISPAIWSAVKGVPKLRTERGGKVFDVAWPMLVQMVAVPLAMQTDRLVLSHVSTASDLAQYNLGSQMYLPVWQVVSAAGVALWPVFARARAKGRRHEKSPVPIAGAFAGGAAIVCLGITIVSPWLARFASGGEITLTWPILLSFSIFMIVQAAKYPLGIFLTDAAGLRYQAFMIVIMVPVNLGLSIVLAARYGAVGPIIGSTIGVVIFELLANYLYVRRAMVASRVSSPETVDAPAT